MGIFLNKFGLVKHAQCSINVVCYDEKPVILSLLANRPPIQKNGFMFFGKDPLKLPPDNLSYFEGLNTWIAYLLVLQKHHPILHFS